MILYSPRASEGGGEAVEDLQNRVIELQEQIVQERSKHKEEMKRGLEAFEKMRKDTPSSQNQKMLVSVDGHDLSRQQRVAIFVDVQNMYYAARNL